MIAGIQVRITFHAVFHRIRHCGDPHECFQLISRRLVEGSRLAEQAPRHFVASPFRRLMRITYPAQPLDYPRPFGTIKGRRPEITIEEVRTEEGDEFRQRTNPFRISGKDERRFFVCTIDQARDALGMELHLSSPPGYRIDVLATVRAQQSWVPGEHTKK